MNVPKNEVEMERALVQIANVYLKFTITNSKSKYTQKAILFIQKINRAFASLNPLFQELINNDFFFQDYPGWWESRYSPLFYYSMKNLAVRSFLVRFYE